MHARRYLFKALESDEPHMGPALHLIARLYRVEEHAKALSLSAEQRFALRQRVSARLLGKPSLGIFPRGELRESIDGCIAIGIEGKRMSGPTDMSFASDGIDLP